MKKDIRKILRNTKVLSPVTPYYLKGIASAKDVVKKFMNKPSFTDKLK
tara:strand:- start:23979 stop:24122 length:144 start_codon:yes stop_codon:yes gene_type:complete